MIKIIKISSKEVSKWTCENSAIRDSLCDNPEFNIIVNRLIDGINEYELLRLIKNVCDINAGLRHQLSQATAYDYLNNYKARENYKSFTYDIESEMHKVAKSMVDEEQLKEILNEQIKQIKTDIIKEKKPNYVREFIEKFHDELKIHGYCRNNISYLEVELLNYPAKFKLENYKISFRFMLPDNTIVYQVDNTGIINGDKNCRKIINILCSPVLSIPGKVKGLIYMENGYKALQTAPFEFTVEKGE
jgi:hypothetical protein